MSTTTEMTAEDLFHRATALAARNFLAEAATSFQAIVDQFPEDELADDALYNVGACLLALNQHRRATQTFKEVIHRYPDASISDDSPGRHETGRTAARAYLGLVAAHLGQGDVVGARAACDALARYPDSRIRPAPGIERTFHDVGRSLLLAAAAEPDDCDEIDVDSLSS